MGNGNREGRRETDIQQSIRCALSEYGIVVRMQSGVFYTGQGVPVRIGFPGMSDLMLIGQDGRVSFIEVKSRTGRVSTEQARFIEVVRGMGYRAGVARSVEEAVRIVTGGS